MLFRSNDMKELIVEVEGADPRYEELRAGAKAAGKGYFEYAVGSQYNRGLTDLFRTLAAQREARPEVSEVHSEEENEESEAKEKDEPDNNGSWEEFNVKDRGLDEPNFERLNPKILS